MKSRTLFLVSTGLGKVFRGFESHISNLAERLTLERPGNFQLSVFSGGRLNNPAFRSSRVFNAHRNQKLLSRLFSIHTMFEIEQLSFLFFFLPHVLIGKPDVIYLGEYKLYCYLFKIRKLLNLDFSLVLYTGGQVSPGLFDPAKDFVHHVTDIYYRELVSHGFPKERQFVIPHFLNTDFSVDQNVVDRIKRQAGGKRILLSVGSLDSLVKRMHLIPEVAGGYSSEVFPVMLGEWTKESASIKQLMIEKFGADGFIMSKVPRQELGSYYTAADIFILCSKKESFGLVFLEAMYFGLPVICHDFHEARYVLQEHGHFMNMNDIDSLKQDFTRLFPLLGKREQYRLFVQHNYTWSNLRDKYLQMFERVASSREMPDKI